MAARGRRARVSHAGLYERLQTKSFPAQFSRQVGAIFPQALFQAPGPADIPGEQVLPVRLPAYPQTTGRTPFPPTLFVFDLSVPGLRIAESLSRRPALPLIRDNDSVQTLINLVLGFPALILDQEVPLWTQLEYAVAMNPTLALVQLDYYDVIEAAVEADPARLHDPAAFRSLYDRIVRQLRTICCRSRRCAT